MKLRIGIDFDDTICDTATEILKEAIEYHVNVLKRPVQLKEIRQCEDYFYFAHMLEWNVEDVTNFFYYSYPNYLEKVKPLDLAVENIKKLQDLGCQFVIISARRLSQKKDVLQLTKAWLLQNNLKINEVNINKDDKAEMVKNTNCNVFIDDSYKNCLEVLEKNPKVTVFLFNTQFNSDYVNDKLPRVLGWKDLYEKLLTLMEVEDE